MEEHPVEQTDPPVNRNNSPSPYECHFVLPEEIDYDGYTSDSEGSRHEDEDDVSVTSETNISEIQEPEVEQLVPVPPPVLLSSFNEQVPFVYYGGNRIFFDIEVDTNFVGRIILRLATQFDKCRIHINTLCTGNLKRQRSLKMHYSGTRLHRMVSGQYIEGGVLLPMHAEYMPPMHVETPVENPRNFQSHVMVIDKNIKNDFGGSRFFITTTDQVKQCNPNHIPIATVVVGLEVLHHISQLSTDENGHFLSSVTIAHCGSIKEQEPNNFTLFRHRIEKDASHTSIFTKLASRKPEPVVKSVILGGYNPSEDDDDDMPTVLINPNPPTSSYRNYN